MDLIKTLGSYTLPLHYMVLVSHKFEILHQVKLNIKIVELIMTEQVRILIIMKWFINI